MSDCGRRPRQVSESMVELLEDMGMHASSAASGEEAVSFVIQAKDTQDPIRLVILGLKMRIWMGVLPTVYPGSGGK